MSSITFDDDPDPITNPFYYAQNMDAFYDAELQKMQKEVQEEQMKKNLELNKPPKESSEKHKKRKLSLKKSICKPSTSASEFTSYVVRQETAKAHHLIKISIEDLTNANFYETNLEKVNVSVQYIVKDSYDEIMSDTQKLISKVVKELSAVNK